MSTPNNDADLALTRTPIARLDWDHIAHVVANNGALLDTSIVSPDSLPHDTHRQIMHERVDKRRHRVQRFVVTMVEGPMDGAK